MKEFLITFKNGGEINATDYEFRESEGEPLQVQDFAPGSTIWIYNGDPEKEHFHIGCFPAESVEKITVPVFESLRKKIDELLSGNKEVEFIEYDKECDDGNGVLRELVFEKGVSNVTVLALSRIIGLDEHVNVYLHGNQYEHVQCIINHFENSER